ncbi:hypothetical protein [Staphylococcus pseudoxylosus]|uniref:hypothetical protein n=1 Tax=Staphylococcus pseudoxylosus TaxID=2282419 RepID=UPI001304BFE5|nr:hypothetical protein [Staphylococcus pseudoxylosus]MEB5783616.1 hypothetical protein [Staphylococcus pseudoxylosus]
MKIKRKVQKNLPQLIEWAWDNYLLCVEENARNEYGNNEALIKHAVELNKKIFTEDE